MNRGTGLPYRLLVAGWIGGLALLSPFTQAGGGGRPDLRTVFQGQQIHLPGGDTLPMADILGHRPLVLQFLTPPCRRCEQDDDLIRQQSFEAKNLLESLTHQPTPLPDVPSLASGSSASRRTGWPAQRTPGVTPRIRASS